MKRKILWLASWYPSKHEPLSGDFIERHAKAASLLHDITVIHVIKSHTHLISGNSIVTQKYAEYPSLTSVIGYYHSEARFLSSFFSLISYFRLLRKLIRQYIRENGKPDLINVHISFKAGLGALYAKWRYGINYIVSEHWTIFCPEAMPSFYSQPVSARMLISVIYKNALRCSAVSHYLARSLAGRFGMEEPLRIPNVVDTTIFYPSAAKHGVFTFIHISVLNYQKSPEEIIDAVDVLRQKAETPFQLIMYGPFISSIADKIKEKNLEKVIQYRQEVMQQELSDEVRKCHSLILYSRFETFGCVVIEALASGLPVIVSDIPVMHELVVENVNGTFADINNPGHLAEKMLWMIRNYESFDREKISRQAGEKYSFLKIAREFNGLYSKKIKARKN